MKYKSEALQVAHDMAKAIYKVGGMTEAEMRDFDCGCLVQDDAPPSAPPGAVQHESAARRQAACVRAATS